MDTFPTAVGNLVSTKDDLSNQWKIYGHFNKRLEETRERHVEVVMLVPFLTLC